MQPPFITSGPAVVLRPYGDNGSRYHLGGPYSIYVIASYLALPNPYWEQARQLRHAEQNFFWFSVDMLVVV